MFDSLVLKKKEEKTISVEEIVNDLSNEAVFNTNNEDIRCVLLPNVYTKSWTIQCDTINVHDFDVKTVLPGKENKLNQPGIQIFNYTARLAKTFPGMVDNVDWTSWPFWKYWNGLVFIDADTKKYQGYKAKTLKWDKIEECVLDYLRLNFHDNFYFEQRSNSQKSFHFVFYVKCEKTYENFIKACKYFKKLVIEAFSALDLKDVIEWPEVMDEHNDNPIQPLFFSNNPINFCFKDTEKRSFWGNHLFLSDINLLVNEKDDVDFDKSEIKFNIDNISTELKNITDITKISWSHDYRLRLAICFYHIFSGNYDIAVQYYNKIIPYMVKTINNHTERELQTLFAQQFHKLGNYSISRNMLKLVKNILNISYKIKKQFEPIKFSDDNYDKIYKLNNNQYLSDIISNIYNLPSNIIHINAGCGIGKTYSANTLCDNLNNKTTEDKTGFSIDDIFDFNMSKHRICFITPMTSINIDNFSPETSPNWKIIDGLNYKNRDYLNSDFNICTTWDSFIKHKMYEIPNFDCFMFDEVHTFYMYNYRTGIIAEIKDKIRSISLNKKVLLLTGTPSLETKEFDCFKVKVEKELINIKANIIVYNEQYLGYLTKDIMEWTKLNQNNEIAIFTNNANFDLMEKFKLRGINIQFLYNKQIENDVNYARENHQMKGNSGLFSVYGQAGINLHANNPIRIYILDNSGMNIIQYANRFRNREMIESVNIFYNIQQLSSHLKQKDVLSEDEIKIKINKLSSIYKTMFNKNRLMMKIKFGLDFEYIDCDKNSDGDVDPSMMHLNTKKYDVYQKIQKVQNLECQMQMIYNRFISNYFVPNFIYLDDDISDQWRSKFKGHFSGGIIQATNNFKKFIKWSTKDEKLYVNTQGETNELLAKTCPESTKSSINYIVNSLLYFQNQDNPNMDFDEKYKNIQKQWTDFVGFCLSRDCNSIRKSDINNFQDVIYIKKHLHELKDGFIVGEILKKRDKVTGKLGNMEICQLAAAYTTVFRNPCLYWVDCFDFAEESYANIKKLSRYIDEYKWFFDFNSILQNYDDVRKSITKEKVWENQQIFDKLYNNHQRGKIAGKSKNIGNGYGECKANNCKSVEINGITYNSKTEAMKKLGIGRKKLDNMLKNV